MKKLLLGIILGFILHSGMTTLHSYAWWTAEVSCRKIDKDKISRESNCMSKRIGIVNYIGFASGYVSYNWQEWGWSY